MSTNFPNGLASRGIPVSNGGGVENPIFGKVWYVNKATGSDSNSGTDPNKAFNTIQKAITTQIAESTGLGDVIYVFPGEYPEALTGNLTKVSIIGVPFWGEAFGVQILPSAASAYKGTLWEARLQNLFMTSPSTSNTELPALHLDNCRFSTIQNCMFNGRAADCVEGLQIGNTDEVATAANCDATRIIGNTFTTFYGAASQFTFGIKIGRVGYDAGASVKQCWGTEIAYNKIFAATSGIYLGISGDKSGGTTIHDNAIFSLEDVKGCTAAPIMAYTANQALVYNNFCAHKEASAAISGFTAGCIVGNYTTQNAVGKNEAAIA
jgi:hypothetical protein